jgi:uncharacterized protein YbcC (UPF0753/DUF2309 family)
MATTQTNFDLDGVLHELKHYLPAQAPLKDFVHHNTLHAFQHLKFNDALRNASKIFGYKTYLSLKEFRALHASGKISAKVLDNIITEHKGESELKTWRRRLVEKSYDTSIKQRIGTLRSNWKTEKNIDLDALVHPILFRVLCSYLDQGISMWDFPVQHRGFLAAIKELEHKSFTSFFRNERAKKLLQNDLCKVEDLLRIVVGDENLYKQYIFDLQFAHQGWSGITSSIEDFPQNLLDPKKISTQDLITFELLLEIDALDTKFNSEWFPLGSWTTHKPGALLEYVEEAELDTVYALWQQAYEWSYYDDVLNGLILDREIKKPTGIPSFQAMFCIDDRECSLRRYIEHFDPNCETFATPGFFGIEFFFQPLNGKFYTKLCPAPVTPKYLIKETGSGSKRAKDPHFTKHSHSLFRGWLITQTLGYWSALKLFFNMVRPTMSPGTAHSFRHMDKNSQLTIENTNTEHRENDLQVGFTLEEMANRVEGVLKSTGCVKDFSPLIYMFGHGSSSVNNPHYAAYDCGACCGRPGSVNARVFSHMANNMKVRAILSTRGIDIPHETQFVGGLHDTCRDEMQFFDEQVLSEKNRELHRQNEKIFAQALDYNSKERSRRLESVNTCLSPAAVHEKIRQRSVSLFEPRPELNHATNALCIVGKRELTKDLFLDRRAFMNSFDSKVDPEGKYLLNILNAAAPVCGGINLEYFFSRVDNQKLGAGTKLPHNVMGLFGVANGIDGDLRPGLPSQMIEVHDPVRLLMIVEHMPEVVMKTIQINPATYEWFINEWVNLVVIHPETKELYKFRNGAFEAYHPVPGHVGKVDDVLPLAEVNPDNIPVCLIK